MVTKRNGSDDTHGPHESYVPFIVQNIRYILLPTAGTMVEKSQLSRRQQLANKLYNTYSKAFSFMNLLYTCNGNLAGHSTCLKESRNMYKDIETVSRERQLKTLPIYYIRA